MRHLILLFSILCSNLLLGQSKELVLSIEHLMGGQPLTDSLIGSNNLGNQFKYSRLQYYVDDIQIIYNQGDTFTYSDVLLIDALAEPQTTVPLGSLNFDSITAVRFAVGVGPDVNNLDPSTYPPNHPLAPKNPSMHWGWAAGYRFLCAEGVGSSSFNQVFELHGLGNANYALQTIPTSGTPLGTDTLNVEVRADYSALTNYITVASGTISHGETGDALQALSNLNNEVFTSAQGAVAMNSNESTLDGLRLYPNPTSGTIHLSGLPGGNVRIYNSLGSLIEARDLNANDSFQLNAPGVYVAHFTFNGSSVVKRFVVN